MPGRFRIRRNGSWRRVSARKLVAFLRRHPKQSYAVRYVPPPPPPRERIVRVALAEVGVHEDPPGSNSGQRVKEYQSSTSVFGTGWPWCQAFVHWVVTQAGVDMIYDGAYVPDFERAARNAGRWSTTPQRGDAVVFNFDNDPEAEHVGIVRAVNPDGSIEAIEGNTSPTASGSQANGGGVYKKHRPRNQCKGFVRLTP